MFYEKYGLFNNRTMPSTKLAFIYIVRPNYDSLIGTRYLLAPAPGYLLDYYRKHHHAIWR